MATQYYYRNKSFTLIEILAVLIILSVIAAIALPNYSNFILRSRVTTMYEAAGPIKFTVANDYYNQSALPSYASNTTSFTTTQSVYISTIRVASGIIYITGNATNLYNTSINLTIVPTINSQAEVIWTCCANNSANLDYIPPDCRNTYSSLPATCPSVLP